MFSEIDLISSYHYIDDLNSINIKHLEMFPVNKELTSDSTKYINSMDIND